MAKRWKIDNQNGAYFLTFTAVDWVYVFHDDSYKQILCDSLNHCTAEKGLEIFAYVLMSTHMHLIATSGKNDLSDIIRDFKKFTSGTIIRKLEKENNSKSQKKLCSFSEAAKLHSRNKNFQLWKQNNHPVEVYSPKFTLQKLRYIHNNPVKAGMVNRPEDYFFSSAVDYAGGKGPVNVSVINLF